jgi:putative DNA primase/helicase
VGELDKVAEAQVKAFVAGDTMEFERKFQAAFNAKPTARLVLATNNPPSFSDRTDGLWRRMLLLRCDVTIPEAERIAGMDSESYWRDAGELPGILIWALCGLRQLRDAGRFIIPESCQSEVNRLRADCNPAKRFLQETYEAGPPDRDIDKCQVYERYRQWCKDNGHLPLASNKLAVEVFRTFPAVRATKRTTSPRTPIFVGLVQKPANCR